MVGPVLLLGRQHVLAGGLALDALGGGDLAQGLVKELEGGGGGGRLIMHLYYAAQVLKSDLLPHLNITFWQP